jgi:hypothetical protein
MLMETDRLRSAAPTNSRTVVALFGQTRQVSDAVADLTLAGFGKCQIRVGFAKEGHPNLGESKVKRKGSIRDWRGEHTLSWRLRRSFELDLHTSGKDQMARKDKDSLSSAKMEDLYSKVNLHETLMALCTRDEKIRLLKSEIGPRGAIVFVDAADRWNEAESILARVAGKIRTDTAAE